MNNESDGAETFGPFTNQSKELAIQTVAHCSTVITIYRKILTGEKPTARATLVLAQSEGRDYFGDIRKKMAGLLTRRLGAAEYLHANGQKVRKLAEYRAAAAELSTAAGVSSDDTAGVITVITGADQSGIRFHPVAGQAMALLVDGCDQLRDIYLVEPSIEHPGFFFLSHMSKDGAKVEFLTRPIAGDFVGRWLKAEGLPDPAGADWRLHPCAGVYKAGQSIHPALEAA